LPELPEVETIRRDFETLLTGKKIIKVEIVPDPKGFRALRRFPSEQAFIREVEGRTITQIDRRGKYLLLKLDTGDTLIVHLGMTGQLLYREGTIEREDFTRIAFIFNGYELRFTDARKFGELYLYSPGRYEDLDVSKLGPEPLSDAFTPDYLTQVLAKKKKAIKPVLMDQDVIAGIGNIYSDEILFEARIHPKRPASSLQSEEIRRLHQATQVVLERAILFLSKSTTEPSLFLTFFGQIILSILTSQLNYLKGYLFFLPGHNLTIGPEILLPPHVRKVHGMPSFRTLTIHL
jgi:formamidopyrimidine-DNA glycosylase